MELLIKIWDNEVTASLIKGKKTFDSFSFELNHDISEKLLPEIDKLLKRNNLELKDIIKANFKTNIKDAYTSVRIGKVIVKTFNWAKKQEEKIYKLCC